MNRTEIAGSEQSAGTPFPLGVSWIARENAWNFALYSRHAEQVTLLLYGAEELTRPLFCYDLDFRRHKSGPIWHCRVPRSQAPDARYYAYRVDGPASGPGFAMHAFDGQKLLVDPYARSIYFPPGFDREAARQPGSNEGHAPLALLHAHEPGCDWGDDRPVRRTSDLVIYEMHVRGFTCDESSGVSEQNRGTFAGVVDRIPYLQELGVTAVQLMPVFQFDPQDGNYWGYMPLGFFAPHHGYSCQPLDCQQHCEFQGMVQALHAAGIEVILDVVYNHTCEGDQRGPIYSYKGIDNSTYYLLTGDPARPYQNFTGTGNTLHTANRAVRQLILDSLRYWVTEMHVDGFRFDLASVFTRSESGSVSPDDPPIFGQISAEPELADIRLIAEPWDAGGAYQLGRGFPGQLWMQWNAHYRDTLQRFVRGDTGLVADLMTRMYGSSDLFPDDLLNACRPRQSVNYITSHDGFTLYDLVSYNQRRNWANGHDNTDGANDFSSNCGWEGDDGLSAEVLQVRKQQVKNFCCLLLLSAGTPMFRMGDEFLQTQGGNNNPYNQDNATTWLDWRRLDEHRDMFRFFRQMIAFRKRHPSIGRAHFWRDDISWYGTSHAVDMSDSSHTLAYCLHGESQGDHDLYVMINASGESLQFGIHEGAPGQWRRAVDTAQPTPNDIIEEGAEPSVASNFYPVQPHSVVVLVR
ncbi:MAG: isoamylase [Planctomycetaceae bacterium]